MASDRVFASPSPGPIVPPARRRFRERFPRGRKRWGLGLAVAVIGPVLLGLVSAIVWLTLPPLAPARLPVLALGLRSLDAFLPGTITWSGARWPRAGRVELENVLWMDGADTLADVRHATVDIGIVRLLRHDLSVNELAIDAPWVDLAGIRGRLHIDTAATRPARRWRWLRDGPVPGIPSLALRDVRIEAPRVNVVPGGARDRLSFEGNARLIHGERPGIAIGRLALEHPARALRIDDARMTIDLAGQGRVDASGHGQFGDDWPFALTGSTTPSGEFTLSLMRRGAAGVRTGDGITAGGRFERRGWRMPGVQATFHGALRDVAGHGEWTARDGRHEGRVRARIQGKRWLSLLMNASALPDTMSFALDARLAGPAQALATEFRAVGRCRISNVAFEHTTIAGAGTIGRRPRVRFALATHALNANARTSGEMRVDGPHIEFRATPIRLEDVAAEPTGDLRVDPADVPRAGANLGPPSVMIETERSLATIRTLRFVGDFGDGYADGRLVRASGPFTMHLAWPRPPAALMTRGRLSQPRFEGLRRAWGDPLAYRADLRGVVDAEAQRVIGDGRFTLPGPAAFVGFLPAGASVTDLEPLVGDGRFDWKPPGWKVSANLDPTRWAERLRFEAHGDSGYAALDQLDAVVPGMTATLRTTLRGEALDGKFEARITDPVFLSRFVPSFSATRLRAAVQGRLRGTSMNPDADFAFIAGLDRPGVYLPQFSGRGLVRARRLERIDAVAARGAIVGSVPLDSLRVVYLDATDVGPGGAAGPAGTLPGRMRIVAGGSGLAWTQEGRLGLGATTTLWTDSLRVRVYDKELRARAPFAVRLMDGGFEVDRMSLEGSLGTLSADGVATRTTSRLTLDASLSPPALPSSLRIPSGLAPTQLEIHLAPARGDSLEMTFVAHGLQIASRKNVVARGRLLGVPRRIIGTASLEGETGRMLEVTAELPGRLAVLAPETEGIDGPLRIDARLTGFPLPPNFEDPLHAPGYLDRSGMGRAMAMDGEVRLRGTGEHPEGTLTGVVSFPGWPGLKGDHYGVQVRLQSGVAPGRAFRHGVARGPEFAVAADTGGAGVSARFLGSHNGQDVIEGHAWLPLRVSFAPARIEPVTGRSMSFALDAAALPLQMLEPFLPALERLRGTAQVHVQAHGSPRDPELEARVMIEEINAISPQHSNVVAHGELTASGRRSRPAVRGRLEIDHGIFTLPEQQNLLHPTRGQALLWQGAGVVQADVPDRIEHPTPQVNTTTTEAPPHGPATPGSAAEEARALATATHAAAESLEAGSDLLRVIDLDVRIIASGGTRIRGRGLDVDLGGDVRLTQRDGIPTLVGEVKAVGGGMQLYGRRMTVESGTVTFYGERRLDPALDVTLARRSRNLDIVAHVTGTAAHPRVDIESDPPLDQSEIISYLLFDRPVGRLDAAQNVRVEEQASSQAEAYLAAQLTGRLSESLGLDLLTYERSLGDSTGTGNGSGVVTLGKYVAPSVLVKVERDLANERGFDVVLEYWIRRGVRVSTHTQEDRAGVDVNWTTDY